MDLIAFLDITPKTGQMVNTINNVATPHTWDVKEACSLLAVKILTCKSNRKKRTTLYLYSRFSHNDKCI